MHVKYIIYIYMQFLFDFPVAFKCHENRDFLITDICSEIRKKSLNHSKCLIKYLYLEGRKEERKGRRKEGKKGEREGGRKRWREERKEGGRERRRECRRKQEKRKERIYIESSSHFVLQNYVMFPCSKIYWFYTLYMFLHFSTCVLIYTLNISNPFFWQKIINKRWISFSSS